MDQTSVPQDAEFSRAIVDSITDFEPGFIIETGTHLGLGTTRTICDCKGDAIFCSIEINPIFCGMAKQNCPTAAIMCGLSIPRRLLPGIDQISADIKAAPAGVFVDYANPRQYIEETEYPGCDHDMLGILFKSGDPDFILLDSAGHLGWIEFQYLVGLLRSPCLVALDDVNHIKHYRSLAAIQSDSRFTVIHTSNQRHGSCIARFQP